MVHGKGNLSMVNMDMHPVLGNKADVYCAECGQPAIYHRRWEYDDTTGHEMASGMAHRFPDLFCTNCGTRNITTESKVLAAMIREFLKGSLMAGGSSAL